MSDKQQRDELIAAYEDFLDAQHQLVTEGATGGEERVVTPEYLYKKGDISEDTYLLITRSGKQYPRSITPFSPVSNPSPSTLSLSMAHVATNTGPNAANPSTPQGSGTPPPPGAPQVSAPIKVMPSGASVREFSHEEGDDYSARDFIQLCENVMRNCSISEPADKIAFVQSRIKYGSDASQLMRVSAITQPAKDQDYDTFRHQFLQIFGENVKHSLVKGVHLAAERILAKVDSQSADKAMVDANIISEDLLMYLKDNNWLTAGQMSEANLLKFLEFFIYMLELKGKIRKGSQELSYEPTNKLYEFVAKIKAKKDATLGETALISPVVEATNITSGIAALSPAPTRSADDTASKPAVVCNYCKKPGHPESRCYVRRNDTKKAQRAGGTSSAQSTTPVQQSFPRDYNKRPPPRSSTTAARPQSSWNRGVPGERPYCLLHEISGHSTESCYAMARIRRDMKQQGNSRAQGSSSGEAARPRKHDPT